MRLSNIDSRLNRDGFTIIELMIAITCSSIAIIVMMNVFTNLQRNSVSQVSVSMMQQNLRGSLSILGREFRDIGRDRLQSSSFGVTDIRNFTASAKGTDAVPDLTPDGHPILQFTRDLNDNAVLDGDETFTYLIFDGDGDPATGFDLARIQGSPADPDKLNNRRILAEGIEEIGFAYAFDADDDGEVERKVINPGDPPSIQWAVDTNNDNLLDQELDGTFLATPVPARMIRGVQIQVLARTGRQDRKYVDQQVYTLGLRVVRPLDIATNTQNFRHWLVTENYHLRNY